MKCKYCGGDVTLNDHFCPHCGRPVDQAQRHQKEMREYEKEFEETKQEAISRIDVSSGGGTAVGIRLAAIFALIIVLIVMAINLDGYTMNENRERRAANKNYDAYVAQIEQYLADRDYRELAEFENKHRLDSNDKFSEYRYIFYALSDYAYILRGLEETAFIAKDSRTLYYAESLSEHVNRFYETILSENSSYNEAPEKTQAVYKEMEEDLAVMLQRYLHLTKEETDSLRGLSKSRRKVLIESALDNKIVSLTGVGLAGMKKGELPQIGATQEVQE